MLSAEEILGIVDELKSDSRIRGILVTGSYVYGMPNEQSDLDVRCVTSDPLQVGEKERIRFRTKVEVYIDTLEKVRFYMKQSLEEGHGACIHFWTYGKIVYDPENIAGQLKKEARELWCKGRVGGEPWKIRAEKYKKYVDMR